MKKTAYTLFISLLALIGVFSLSSTTVNAQGTTISVPPPAPETQSSQPSQLVTLENPLKFNSVGEILNGFITIITYLAILFGVIMIIWTGFQYILARGNTEKLTEESKRLGAILIGVALVLAARLMISIIINTLQATGTVSPNVINSAQNAINQQ